MPSSRSSVDKRDVYYRKGKSEGYRARSAYKLLHLDEAFDLFSGVRTAVDLCAAPGSWSQVLGQKLAPGPGIEDSKVVSLDLQPMAPLPNITLLQADITRPSTVPRVLAALGGRKAGLVVCDGAPDVTGVHDLDAHLHAQLLRAALTLALTLLAPGATLVFKIFLSPLDPRADGLRSQLRCFFPPRGNEEEPYAEFESEEEGQGMAVDGDKRSGVWVRKPRSSRKGSGEAFIVCRGFDPSTVPIPPTFTPAELDALRLDEGTLTLESLATNTMEGEAGAAWERIRAYVGRGNLDPQTSASGSTSTASSRSPSVQSPSHASTLRLAPPSLPAVLPPKSPSPTHGVRLQIQTAQPHAPPDTDGILGRLSSQPTPIEPTKADISLFPPSPSGSRFLHASPSMRRALAANHARRRSADLEREAAGSSPVSPTHATTRPWDRHGPPSPLPSPMWDFARPPLDDALLNPSSSHPAMDGSGAPSPALSTGSKTDMFFATSQRDSLPVPPRALASAPPGAANVVGLGRPGQDARRDRAVTQPAPPLAMAVDVRVPTSPLAHTSSLPDDPPPLRAVSTPFKSPRLAPHGMPSVARADPLFGPLSSLPTLPHVADFGRPERRDDAPPMRDPAGVKRPAPTAAANGKRGSVLLRETREVWEDETVHAGDVLRPAADDQGALVASTRHLDETWKLGELLGEGAFSAVWSAEPVDADGSAAAGTDSARARPAAIKLMPKRICEAHHRTRIAFAREVEVLRHLAHPSVVAFLGAFSTATHHCLVVERLAGGELFDVLARDGRRERLLRSHEGDSEGEGVVRRIFGELGRAVAWLHEVGVVHRDIKLENILLTVDPFSLSPAPAPIPLDRLQSPLIKLSDFGLSRLIPADGTPLTTRCGSEAFAAPEIIMGRPYDGRATDAWACGVVLYALVAGELPFDDDAPRPGRSRASSVASNASDGGGGAGGLALGAPAPPPTPASQRRRMMRIAKGEYGWRAGVGSEGVRRVVGRLLVRDPTRRAALRDVWDEGWMDGSGAVARPGGPADVDGEAGRADPLDVGALGDEWRTRGRRVWDGLVLDGASDMARAESADV